MAATRLIRKDVEKVWGRRDLPDMFGGGYRGAEPLGEIWFEHPDGRDVELLVKYLFTSQRLSIQVHPDDAAARAAGHRRGKDEAWIVLSADPGAEIGLGLTRAVAKEELAQAARDGSIETLVDWRPAAAGDVLYSPAGTVHALGPGLVLIEIQQNADLTYRLYDYGRPRELHRDEGVRVANAAPHVSGVRGYARSDGREVLAEGRCFVLERLRNALVGELRPAEDQPVWLVPVRGRGRVAGRPLEPGDVWLVDSVAALSLEEGAELLVAYPGASAAEALIG